ncbi:hypothetical protein Tco_1020417, partial [Tanacetum coccineum]
SKEDHSKKKPEVDYDSSSDEVSDRKPRKIKAEVKRKRKGGPNSDSDSFDEEDHSKKQKNVIRTTSD